MQQGITQVLSDEEQLELLWLWHSISDLAAGDTALVARMDLHKLRTWRLVSWSRRRRRWASEQHEYDAAMQRGLWVMKNSESCKSLELS